jgi:hypothetical protein
LALYRAYSAPLGRWLSRDPISEAGGINLYAYIQNSPVEYADSTGFGPSYPWWDLWDPFNDWNNSWQPQMDPSKPPNQIQTSVDQNTQQSAASGAVTTYGPATSRCPNQYKVGQNGINGIGSQAITGGVGGEVTAAGTATSIVITAHGAVNAGKP